MVTKLEVEQKKLRDMLNAVTVKERHILRLSIIISVICLIAGLAWVYFAVRKVKSLRNESASLQEQRDQLNNQIKDLNKKRDEITEQLDSFYEAANLEDNRRQAVLLTLALQDRNVRYLMGGRRPEAGLDTSGFIVYVLSRPEIGILRQSDLFTCNQPCLMQKTKAVTATSLPPDLQPGDLIYYPYKLTVMYVGNNKTRGMIWEAGIQTHDINYWPIIGYSKISYQRR